MAHVRVAEMAESVTTNFDPMRMQYAIAMSIVVMGRWRAMGRLRGGGG